MFRLVRVLASVKLFETIGPQKEFSRFKADSKLLPILRKAIVSCLLESYILNREMRIYY